MSKSARMSSGSVTLRPYQERDVERLRESYRSGAKAPLYVAPCGAGKTILFAHMAQAAVGRGWETMILVHRKELIEQCDAALERFGLRAQLVTPGAPYRRNTDVTVASVFSLESRLEQYHPRFIIIDEAHHVSNTTTWGRILKAYPTSRRLGVTATPARMDGAGLGDFFDAMVVGPSYEELIDGGYLTKIKAWAPPIVDASGLAVRGGDYQHAGIVERANRPGVTGDCIEHYREIAPGQRAVVFDVSVESARARAEAFRAAGYRSACIEGTLDRQIRRLTVEAFRRGEIQVLTSVDLVSEGFDLPAIEVAICLRPTASQVLWRQQTGRIMRPCEGKEYAILLDHAGNIDRHGMPDEFVEWSLDKSTDVVHKTSRPIGPRICLSCFAVNKAHAVVCGQCGVPLPRRERQVKQKKGRLEPLTPEELQKRRDRRTRAFNQSQAQDLPALIAIAKARGMADPVGWANHVMAARAAKGRLHV